MEIERYEIPEDIVTFYVAADPFLAGIQQSYNRLEEIVLSFNKEENSNYQPEKSADTAVYRTGLENWEVYGVTETLDGKVVYRACAAERYPGEGRKYELPVYIIPKGTYLSMNIENWQAKTMEIGSYFHQLFQHPDVKEHSVCLEYYESADEMQIMVQHK